MEVRREELEAALVLGVVAPGAVTGKAQLADAWCSRWRSSGLAPSRTHRSRSAALASSQAAAAESSSSAIGGGIIAPHDPQVAEEAVGGCRSAGIVPPPISTNEPIALARRMCGRKEVGVGGSVRRSGGPTRLSHRSVRQPGPATRFAYYCCPQRVPACSY